MKLFSARTRSRCKLGKISDTELNFSINIELILKSKFEFKFRKRPVKIRKVRPKIITKIIVFRFQNPNS